MAVHQECYRIASSGASFVLRFTCHLHRCDCLDKAQSISGSRPATVHPIPHTRDLNLGSVAEEVKTPDPLAAAAAKAGAVLMVCRTCHKKGDHWTAQCPYKDLAAPTDTFIDKPSASEAAPAAGARSGTYVSPGMRGGGSGERSLPDRRRNDENSVRVTNLSEDTREPDLLELFRTFGPVSRVYVAVDQKTGVSRGFGFVNFVHREDAERAINKLNGYGYDNLILRVEDDARDGEMIGNLRRLRPFPPVVAVSHITVICMAWPPRYA
ncbi:hypothetical protein Taro_012657 [Colocasia esculenta]|uniref:RRM domain-containing protein n=1 Tax=Colocasia esculenta TaxID=4460 RepID=A0A843UDE1_COLES|nr:hypothetical protein [Colocasia esculenta]